MPSAKAQQSIRDKCLVIAPKKYKKLCVACGAENPQINKEHFWPKWLIERTGTHKTSVLFNEAKRINPKSLVVPLCARCNTDFGRELEAPVSHIFNDLEANRGISHTEAELLIRWLWKFEGLIWSFCHPNDTYNEHYTLRERVLTPIDDLRSKLTLAISLLGKINPSFQDAPMGIDSWNHASAIFVSGVFSRVAIMVLDSRFENYVPSQFSMCRLVDRDAPDRNAKFFYPKIGFQDCAQAVEITLDASLALSHAHDLDARNHTT